MRNKLTSINHRRKRVKANIKSRAKFPIVCIFRSNKHIYAQIIDHQSGKVIFYASDLAIKNLPKSSKTDKAYAIGKLLASQAAKSPIKNVVLDRGAYKFHGRVKSLTEGIISGGLKFTEKKGNNVQKTQ